MNRGVLEVARKYIHGTEIPEPMLNRVEAVIRCFDPCLSCSTHAIGEMPLVLQLLGADGQVLDELAR
jgi:NAD-reducing hydrogenase large subunit